jgi:hypothetical protein
MNPAPIIATLMGLPASAQAYNALSTIIMLQLLQNQI